jgi:hypothetical protein
MRKPPLASAPRLARTLAAAAGLATVAGALLSAAPAALAQCPMCGLSTESNQWSSIFKGVMVLLVPAAIMVGGLAWFSWKHRK